MNERVTFKKLNFQCCDSRFFDSSFFLKSVKSNTEFMFFFPKIRPEWETGFAMSQIWKKTSDRVSGGTLLLLKAEENQLHFDSFFFM